MIIKTSARGEARRLAAHLINTDDNEQVSFTSSRYLSVWQNNSVAKSLQVMDALAAGTGKSKNLFHVSFNPDQIISEDDWQKCWSEFETEYNLGEQAFIEVTHTKQGRTHKHRVYNRIRENGTEISIWHNYLRNEKIARKLEYDLGHNITIGKHNAAVIKQLEKEGLNQIVQWMESAKATEVKRPVAEKTWPEQQQEKRTGIEINQVKADLRQAYEQTDNGKAFEAAILSMDYLLARGERAGTGGRVRHSYVIVDRTGNVHGLGRCLGVKKTEIKQRFSDLSLSHLPSVTEAKTHITGREIPSAKNLEELRSQDQRLTQEIKNLEKIQQIEQEVAEGKVTPEQIYYRSQSEQERSKPLGQTSTSNTRGSQQKLPSSLEPYNQRTANILAVSGAAAITERDRRLYLAQIAATKAEKPDPNQRRPIRAYLTELGQQMKAKGVSFYHSGDKYLAEKLAQRGYSKEAIRRTLLRASPNLLNQVASRRQSYLRSLVERFHHKVAGYKNQKPEAQKKLEKPDKLPQGKSFATMGNSNVTFKPKMWWYIARYAPLALKAAKELAKSVAKKEAKELAEQKAKETAQAQAKKQAVEATKKEAAERSAKEASKKETKMLAEKSTKKFEQVTKDVFKASEKTKDPIEKGAQNFQQLKSQQQPKKQDIPEKQEKINAVKEQVKPEPLKGGQTLVPKNKEQSSAINQVGLKTTDIPSNIPQKTEQKSFSKTKETSLTNKSTCLDEDEKESSKSSQYSKLKSTIREGIKSYKEKQEARKNIQYEHGLMKPKEHERYEVQQRQRIEQHNRKLEEQRETIQEKIEVQRISRFEQAAQVYQQVKNTEQKNLTLKETYQYRLGKVEKNYVDKLGLTPKEFRQEYNQQFRTDYNNKTPQYKEIEQNIVRSIGKDYAQNNQKIDKEEFEQVIKEASPYIFGQPNHFQKNHPEEMYKEACRAGYKEEASNDKWVARIESALKVENYAKNNPQVKLTAKQEYQAELGRRVNQELKQEAKGFKSLTNIDKAINNDRGIASTMRAAGYQRAEIREAIEQASPQTANLSKEEAKGYFYDKLFSSVKAMEKSEYPEVVNKIRESKQLAPEVGRRLDWLELSTKSIAAGVAVKTAAQKEQSTFKESPEQNNNKSIDNSSKSAPSQDNDLGY
ncbi:hypothetical protein Xen7305DRAFT_00024320 [Xenococcus sp. PCC 7305]|uniref:relaxase/mobilization nuclease domain-containing protein n=1 Tax=Xenococcus sp. PCC 7305 TaxID=102125 RepID=UPI0002AC637A|nr:hypothetical protein [Xenococcus sp. PCC 7305]ELS02714.1 hypothetical protein Xen7305DRAFT_00024320 [Xenococcus sp. PCC 7305]